MKIPKEIYKKITKKHGTVIDLKKNPEILEEIVTELRALQEADFVEFQRTTDSPFKIGWMDSWVANWVIHERSRPDVPPEKEFTTLIRQLVDLKFKERLAEIKRFITEYDIVAEPPDGGPPEPGTPPGGPASFAQPPDGGPPEPGTPPGGPASFAQPPDGGPPEPGTPPGGPASFAQPPDGGPPEPGAPNPPGPERDSLRDNPWILYWFVSINAPLILEMIDAHFTRRMNDIRSQTVR